MRAAIAKSRQKVVDDKISQKILRRNMVWLLGSEQNYGNTPQVCSFLAVGELEANEIQQGRSIGGGGDGGRLHEREETFVAWESHSACCGWLTSIREGGRAESGKESGRVVEGERERKWERERERGRRWKPTREQPQSHRHRECRFSPRMQPQSFGSFRKGQDNHEDWPQNTNNTPNLTNDTNNRLTRL